MGNFTKKVASAVVAITTSVSMLGGGSLVAVAGAQSVTDLQTQINALLAQIAALSSSTTMTSCTAPAPSLTTGAKGAAVTALQQWLIANGYAIPAGATGYFGGQTVAAVKAFQVAKGIAPAAGFYGPKTAAAVQAMCTTTTGPVTPVPGTGLSVSTAIDNPTAQSIAKGATRLVMMKVNVAGNGTLNTMAFHRYGAGASSDFSNVYLYDGDVRLTSGRSVNSTSNMVTFTGLNLPVAGVKTLSLVVDFSASAGSSNQNGFELVAASDVTASVAVMGSFPVRGNLFSVTGASVGGITIARTGSLSNPSVGQTTAKVAEFQLTASSVEDLWVRSLTLFNVGNVSRSGLSNFVLKQAGTTVATASAINSRDQIVFVFNAPFSLTKGSVRTFELFVDLAGTIRANDTVRLYLENGADLYATGATYGAGVSVTMTAYDNGANDGTDASWTTVEGGDVTIAFQGPSTTDYAVQQQDVVLATFNFTTSNNVEVRNTRILLASGGTDSDADTNDVGGLCNLLVANYTDVKLIDVTTGTVLTGSKDSTCTVGADDASQTLVYTDVWNNNAGQTRQIKITADVANFTPVANETVRAQWNSFTASDIKNLDNNLFVATGDIVPSGNITGATHNVKSGSLTTSLAGTPVAQTYINGTQNVAMVGINFTAGTGKDVKITGITLTSNEGANSCATETDCVLTVQLFDGATAVSDLRSLSTTTVTFSNLAIMVPKGITKTIVAKVNLVTLGTVAGSTTLDLDIEAAGDVTAVDSDGNTVSNSGTVAGPTHTIAGAGTISAIAAPLTADTESRIVVANTNDVTVGGVRFGATNESLEIKKVRITIAAGNIDEVTGITLYNGSTVVGATTVPTSGGVADFSSITGFTVPKDGNLTLTIKVNLNSTSNGADAGASFAVTFDYDDNFEARGAGQTVITTVGAANVVGQSMTLNKSKITINEVALGTSTLSNGSSQNVYAFTVAADAAGDVALKQLKFTVIVTDNVGTNDTLAIGTFQLLRGSTNLTSLVDIHATAGTDLEAATLAEGAPTTAIVTWATEEGITAGSSNTYYLKGTPTGFATPADDDNVKITMANDTAAVSAATAVYLIDLDGNAGQVTVGLQDDAQGNIQGTIAATVTTGPNIVWSDNSVVAHNSAVTDDADSAADAEVSSGDWFNGFLIKNTLNFSGATLIL